MTQGMANFRLHQAKFGRVGLVRGFAQVGLQRGEQGRLVFLQRAEQLLQLRLPKGERTGGPGLEENPLPLAERGKIHIQVGKNPPPPDSPSSDDSLLRNSHGAGRAFGGCRRAR